MTQAAARLNERMPAFHEIHVLRIAWVLMYMLTKFSVKKQRDELAELN